ncbi:MAG: magnesium transporter [Actinomycetota bacterium]
MPHLSTMLGHRVIDRTGADVGRLSDVVVAPGTRFPVVRGIMIDQRRATTRRRLFVPYEDVRSLEDRVVVIDRTVEGAASEPGDIFLARDLLDKQIVDMDGYKIVRVSDIRLSRTGRQTRVIGADVGGLALLRRLGLGSLADRLSGLGAGFGDSVVPWNLVSPVEPMPYDVRLRVPYREYLEIHPSDIADIIEQLDVEARAKVLALVDDPKAAEVLSQVLPGMRPSVAESISDERLSDLLEIMPPDEAADILGFLPRRKAEALLSLMGIGEASVVSELLGYEPHTAGGRMTTEFVAIPYSLTAAEAIEHLRVIGEEAETIYYVYVVDAEGHLSGVLSLRDLLRAGPGETIGDLMSRDLITTELEDDQELVADKLSRYNLLALPVVDDDHVLKGIVTVDDAIDVIREESGEDYSQITGVPFAGEGTPVGGASDARRWAVTALTFLGGIVATALFGVFRSEFVAALALVYFIPLALRASHDVSVWSLAETVGVLRAGEARGPVVRRMFAREYLYALSAALLISVLGFAAGMVWTGYSRSAVAASVGLFVGICAAGVLGALVPVVLSRVRTDPALAPGRLLGVLVMAASMVSFLVVSGLIVGAW